MFTDIGFWEMTIIAVMALLVLGPERLPDAARAIGQWVGKARRMMTDMKRDIKAELDESEMQSLKNVGKDIKQAGEAFKSQVESADTELTAGIKKKTSVMDSAIADALAKEPPVPTEAKAPVNKVAKKATAKAVTTKKNTAKKSGSNASSAQVTKKTPTKKAAPAAQAKMSKKKVTNKESG